MITFLNKTFFSSPKNRLGYLGPFFWFTFLGGFFISCPCFGEEPKDLLKRCLKSQGATERVSMRSHMDFVFHRFDEDHPTHYIRECLFHRDGNRFDISGQYVYPDRKKDNTIRIHAIMNDHHYLEKYNNAWVTSEKRTKMFVMNTTPWLFLDGFSEYLGGKQIAEIMLEGDSLTLLGIEEIEKVPCQKILGKTQHGQFTLWLAEKWGWLPLKLTMEKGPDNLLYQKKLSEEIVYDAPESHYKRCSGVLDSIKIEKIGEHFVTVAGEYSETRELDDGRISSSKKSYKRSEIQINPVFAKNIFVAEIKEAAPVTDLDKPGSGVFYEWREGKLAPAHADFSGTARGHQEGPSLFKFIAFSVMGLILLIAGVWMVLRHKRQEKK